MTLRLNRARSLRNRQVFGSGGNPSQGFSRERNTVAWFCILSVVVLRASSAFAQVASPTLRWADGGVRISTDLGWPGAASDGMGGATFSWSTGFEPHPGAFSQHLSNNGTVLWQEGGVPLNTITDSATPTVTSDGVGGAIVAWVDVRTTLDQGGTQNDIYAQRLNSAGQPQWQVKGVPVVTACWLSGICANQKPSSSGINSMG